MSDPDPSASTVPNPEGRSPVPVGTNCQITTVGGTPVALVTFSTPVGDATYWYVLNDLDGLIRALQVTRDQLSRTPHQPLPKQLLQARGPVGFRNGQRQAPFSGLAPL